jgi:hypothetical protein
MWMSLSMHTQPTICRGDTSISCTSSGGTALISVVAPKKTSLEL